MKFATRLNSFKNKSIVETIDQIASVQGLTHVDLNYPEHFQNNSVEEIKDALKRNNIKLNGIAPRFRSQFINGELGNSDPVIARKAIDLCKESIDICRELGGSNITIWLGYDGFDYAFQLNYAKVWKQVVKAIQEICEYGHDIQVSIEYKPFQPRAYSLISSYGDTLLMINDAKCSNLGATLDFCHMLMKAENPSFGLSLVAEKNKLFGVHLNDGNKLNDDGLIVGSVNFAQSLEFIYYIKKYSYDAVVYFDTFPEREDPLAELKTNIAMYTKLNDLVDGIGMDKIQSIIDQNNAIAAQEIMLGCLK
ncbi:sugar phosphate isomerase/epimerase [Paenibacillus alginolyticus]|uniref:Sugar phosphate isomerase/epimerase n=1 Tax=Paenibacillus alginolyticus TaxID=59839 RepID=A0ABT4GI82_9BACL|nr:sugar phosphate isomerase/epimerase family protein [Paenibacillus alginolyticus]MCY9669531.1 sugar phosphate isomerase/epimerase [Paenibacillus alginolyticus]MCY9695907.1 sugar phosphate isomerase/epimerase [Paenibacillus alginolyticus]MEC0146758.1 sugar phosphate isomerase/epimerase [Paenibacillus alginolyticus]